VEAKAAARRDMESITPHFEFLQAIRDVLPDDGILTDELCQTGFTSWFGYPVYKPRTYISSGYQGTLGAGYPTALGAKVARPDNAVVALCGDGGFMFGVQELATAVQYGIDVVALVFNNSAYGNVRRDQDERFGGRAVASDLVNPDFMKLADSFAVSGARAADAGELRTCLDTALQRGGPWLIEVPLDLKTEKSPWPLIRRG
jgi:acetolactate synthase-1/2/3 large subunit